MVVRVRTVVWDECEKRIGREGRRVLRVVRRRVTRWRVIVVVVGDGLNWGLVVKRRIREGEQGYLKEKQRPRSVVMAIDFGEM